MSIRRRRSFLVRLILIFVCLGIFVQVKYHLFNNISNPLLTTKISQSSVSLNKLRFDCSGDPAEQWCESAANYCDSSLIIFKDLFALTRSIVLQPQFAKGKRIGGEDVKDVLNQAEEDEYFQFEKNFIQLPCNLSNLQYQFPSSHLPTVFKSLTTHQTLSSSMQMNNRTTIAVNRHDYVNFYHTMTDLYTAYALCRFLGKDPKSVQILFLDAHPRGNLDNFWSKLFHSFVRLGHLKKHPAILYDELIWAQPQGRSELDLQQNRRSAPSFFLDFREHVLRQFGLNPQTNLQLDCQALNILFLVRHNYVAHPRNPSGKISRQLDNEKEILDKLKTKFSSSAAINFTSNHFEKLSIEEQLSIILQTDLFLGIHGAGLTHVLFLKPNRALIELVPSELIGTHFELMASINQIKYHRCAITNGASNTAETIYDCINRKRLELCPDVSSGTKKTINLIVTASSSGNVSNTNQK